MSVIKNIFKSKESRAVEHFQLGDNSKNLNEKGLMEFVQFLYETDRETRENFLAKLVKAHKQDTESK